MKNRKTFILTIAVAVLFIALASCNSSNRNATVNSDKDTSASSANTNTQTTKTDSLQNSDNTPEKENTYNNPVVKQKTKAEVHYFHVTNRCPSCIAIETATKKTLNTYFKNEMKNGTVKFYVYNVDDDANKVVSEEYQAFGSSLFVTKIAGGKKIKTDLTGEGFKFARNKEEKFIKILKEKITEALK